MKIKNFKSANNFNRPNHTFVLGTSGDTGSAAINAVKGKKWIDIIVLYPKACPIYL